LRVCDGGQERRGQRAASSGYIRLVFVLAGFLFVLALASQQSAWASPLLGPLRQTIPTRTPTSGPEPTATKRPTQRPTASATAGPSPTPSPTSTLVCQLFQQGVSPAGYAGVTDTYLDSWDKDANHGDDWRLRLRTGDVMAALVRFDLSVLPPDACVQLAELSVYVEQRSNEAPLAVSAYRVLRLWVDTEATWEEARQDEEWEVWGCNDMTEDRLGEAESTQTLGSIGALAWYTFDVTQMTQYWVASPDGNYGLILKAGGTSSVEYGLTSSDRRDNADKRPKLNVCYYLAPPTPTASPTPSATPRPAALEGVVWDDRNANGVFEPEEPTLPDVRVLLRTEQGATLAERTTDAQGRYSFSGLAPARYVVAVLAPNGYEPTTATEVLARPGPGVTLPVNFGLRWLGSGRVIVLPMITK